MKGGIALILAGLSALEATSPKIDGGGPNNIVPAPVDPGAERLFSLVSQAACDLGEPLTWKDTGGVCDGNNIAACGVPVIDTMGARGDFIHSSDEYLEVDSLVARAWLTALVLHRLDKGALPR